MQLTDPRLPWVLGTLAVVILVTLVVGWPRWRHPAAQAASRGLTALLMSGVLITTVFLVLNNQYVFYTSWSDIFSSGGLRSASQHGGPATDALQKVSAPGLGRVAGQRDYALPDPGQRMQRYLVQDPASAAAMRVLVYLPPGYRASSSQRYPVVVGLHGFPSVPRSFTKLNFLSTANALMLAHRMAPTIFVIPQINSPRTLDTECVNGPPGTPQTDTWLARELPDWIVRHLHVETRRQSWATFGYSFGGWCAAELAMRHPGVFAAGVVIEGYFQPDFSRSYVPLTGAALRPYNLVAMAGHNPPPVDLWVFGSKQDKLAYPTTSRFISRVTAPLSVDATIVPTGGHRSSVFEPYTQRALTWLATTLTSFRA